MLRHIKYTRKCVEMGSQTIGEESPATMNKEICFPFLVKDMAEFVSQLANVASCEYCSINPP